MTEKKKFSDMSYSELENELSHNCVPGAVEASILNSHNSNSLSDNIKICFVIGFVLIIIGGISLTVYKVFAWTGSLFGF